MERILKLNKTLNFLNQIENTENIEIINPFRRTLLNSMDSKRDITLSVFTEEKFKTILPFIHKAIDFYKSQNATLTQKDKVNLIISCLHNYENIVCSLEDDFSTQSDNLFMDYETDNKPSYSEFQELSEVYPIDLHFPQTYEEAIRPIIIRKDDQDEQNK